MSNRETDAFYLRIAQALTGCQLVEQQLKLYIAEAFDLVRKFVGNRLPFTMSGDDVQDASLERLINVFKKLCDNKALVSDLDQFKRERNFLSHRGITYCLDPDDELDQGAMVEVEDRLNKLRSEATRLRNAIHEEANKFRGHLGSRAHRALKKVTRQQVQLCTARENFHEHTTAPRPPRRLS